MRRLSCLFASKQLGQRQPGSSARMKASPTRKACTPAARIASRLRRRGMPDSVTSRRSAGHLGQHVQRGVQAHLEGAQVAVVDADQRRLQFERALQFVASCTSTSTAMSSDCGHALRAPPSAHRPGRRRSAGCSRRPSRALRRPGRVDHEVLAQHRQVAGRAGLLQVVDAALEELLSVSTDRQPRCAVALGVALRDVGRNEVGAQHALGRAGLFDSRRSPRAGRRRSSRAARPSKSRVSTRLIRRPRAWPPAASSSSPPRFPRA
jgi:hypothetical protein